MRLSDNVIMSCKQAWWTWNNMCGAKWKVCVMKSIAEQIDGKNPILQSIFFGGHCHVVVLIDTERFISNQTTMSK